MILLLSETTIDKDKVKKYTYALLLVVIGFFIGYVTRTLTHTCTVTKSEPVIKTEVQYKDRVKTEIAYVPKETVIYKNADGTTTTSTEKTDIDVTIPKQQLNVKVNNKEFTINKDDKEEYIFDKNKLTLDQTSTADINITVPTIDNTRKWELGIGASKNGMAGMIGFPIKSNVGGFVAGDKDVIMAGVKISF